MKVYPILLLTLLSLATAPILAQQDSDSSTDNGTKSIAEIAKESRAKASANSKTIINSEDLAKGKDQGPIPRLNMDEQDNSDEISEAIRAFKAKHTPEETERAVRDWYQEYDDMLATAIKGNKDTAQRRQFTTYNGYWICQETPDYNNCVARRNAELRGSHEDQVSMVENFKIISRIQQAFMRIRNQLNAYDLHYSWFRVRNANGSGSF